MTSPLIIALPSKGRLKELVEAWLADCALKLEADGGARGYSGRLKGLDGAQVRLLSAGDIAEALDTGEVHLGVTGEDLMRERPGDLSARALLLRPLGFGRADLVVATPKSWLDVATMGDLEEVAHDILARTGRRIRVATKYILQTRAFFARHGLVDYRIVESGGATEGAPAAGAAELVVDITTTGATLEANGLKVLDDGVILKSQAQLAASLRATWTADQMAVAEALLRQVEARAAARRSATLTWPEIPAAADTVVEALVARGATRRPNGLLLAADDVAEAGRALSRAGLGPVTAAQPDFVFETESAGWTQLQAALNKN
ncbi:MAG: ATP phosphoribosyltransferase [Phenylobacterium sp.]|uniref:ATP phosphoribosyltransferase n=1 Tax=Phenylobacterium sp. TaxID=1871053 RepID=UPI0027353475|nr:ATP phosphoribosyltransferase [Phenylobacterium sp.]MDP1643498.1 ATP phosphoribosyltransferase [Phenylobacterium sp.]MDP3115796.1 ATP phosphoribosyltransferase [Phenylobacterium sp.]